MHANARHEVSGQAAVGSTAASVCVIAHAEAVLLICSTKCFDISRDPTFQIHHDKCMVLAVWNPPGDMIVVWTNTLGASWQLTATALTEEKK